MLIDNFQEQIESCALNAKNAQKCAQNQINSLSTSRNECASGSLDISKPPTFVLRTVSH